MTHMYKIALDCSINIVAVLFEQLACERQLHRAHATHMQRLLVPERLDLLHARKHDRCGARHCSG